MSDYPEGRMVIDKEPPEPDPQDGHWYAWAELDKDMMPVLVIQHGHLRTNLYAAQARNIALQWMRVADMAEGDAALVRSLLEREPGLSGEELQVALGRLAELRHDVIITQAVQLGLIAPDPDIEEQP